MNAHTVCNSSLLDGCSSIRNKRQLRLYKPSSAATDPFVQSLISDPVSFENVLEVPLLTTLRENYLYLDKKSASKL